MLYSRMMATVTQSTQSTPLAKGVVVVGSGLAGLSASLELVSRKVPIHLLERLPKPGGNSIKASSGINGAPTRFQPVPDTEFYADTIKSAGSVFTTRRDQREKLISVLTNQSSSAVYWLADEKGVDLSRVAELGGHSHPRTHRGAGPTPPGAAIVTTALGELKANPLVQIQTSSTVTKVLQAEGEVVGVEFSHDGQTHTLHGPVVFASGGFAGDSHGMVAQYRPDLKGFPSTNENNPGSQSLLTAVGAQLLDMDQIQVHPTGFVDPKEPSKPTKFLAAEVLRGEGGLLLLNSRRFVNEMETRKNVTDKIINTPPADTSPLRQWDIQLVLDEGAYNATKSHVDFYIWKGLVRKATVAELGESAASSIQDFADIAQGKKPDPFGRTEFGHWTLNDVTPESVVYVGRVTPVVHYTMGGVIFNENGEVLDQAGNPIKGLWAAGEVTGGVHGANRLGGSSLLECVVYGRIAGQNAAEFYKKKVGEKEK